MKAKTIKDRGENNGSKSILQKIDTYWKVLEKGKKPDIYARLIEEVYLSRNKELLIENYNKSCKNSLLFHQKMHSLCRSHIANLILNNDDKVESK